MGHLSPPRQAQKCKAGQQENERSDTDGCEDGGEAVGGLHGGDGDGGADLVLSVLTGERGGRRDERTYSGPINAPSGFIDEGARLV